MKKIKKKFTLRKVIKLLLKNSICLIIGIAYLVFWFFKSLNKLVVKMFNKLSRPLKVALIYTLVIGNLSNISATIDFIKSLKVEQKETEIKEVAIVDLPKEKEVAEIVQEEKATCELSEIECKIFDKAIEEELTENQAYLLLAISKHETGSWTSRNFKNKNNLGGLYNGEKDTFYSYDSLESGIEAFVNLLKNRYFAKGLNTIEEIGNIYCPVGASNDPKGLNKHWIPKVSLFYNQYLEK